MPDAQLFPELDLPVPPPEVAAGRQRPERARPERERPERARPERVRRRRDALRSQSGSGETAGGRLRDLHYRAAMRAARSIGRSPRRDQAGRLICHHLRCMLGE
jgi:hypothetical protein